MSEVIEKLKEYYHLEDRDGRLFIWKEGMDKPQFIPKGNRTLCFTFGRKLSEDELEVEVEKGNVIKIKEIELYREFYDWDEETYLMELHGYDKRTKDYFEKVKKEIGYVRTVYGHEEWELKKRESLNIYWNAVDGVLGLAGDGLWCYQLSYQTTIDDYNIEKILFYRKPSVEDIKIARKIEELDIDFYLKKIRPTFRCWECGGKTHWLDVPGDFNQKYESLHERYCGC